MYQNAAIYKKKKMLFTILMYQNAAIYKKKEKNAILLTLIWQAVGV